MSERESIFTPLNAVPSEPPKVHRCSQCGTHGHWGDGWLWYGDHVTGVQKTLCPACAEPHQHEVIA